MTDQKCDFDTDCNDGNVCLIKEKRCIPPEDGLIGFYINKKIYYAKTVEEIESIVQQFVILNKLDFDSMKCNAGVDLTFLLPKPFDDFVNHTFKDLRKQLLELKEDPVNLISIINSSDGRVYCENLNLMKKYFRDKLENKNFQGFLHNKSHPEQIPLMKSRILSGRKTADYFSNFPYWTLKFILINDAMINNLDTIVYYLVKLANVNWIDTNPRVVSAYHNYDIDIDTMRGDDLYILVPIGDMKFFCNEYNGKCKSLFWDRQQPEPVLWKDSYSSLEECEKNKCEKNKYADGQFLQCVQTNDLNTAKHLYAKGGVSINMLFGNKSYLYFAISNDNKEMASFLIDSGANTFFNYRGKNLLHIAIENENMEIIKLLVEKGVDINFQDRKGNTALHELCKLGNLEIIKFLLDNGAYVNVQNSVGMTPLHLSIMSENIEMVELLIRKGADINITDKRAQTPIELAVSLSNLDIVKLLLKNKAKIDIKNSEGDPFIFTVISYFKDAEILGMFMKNVNINSLNKQNHNLLQYELSLPNSNINTIKFLIDNGCDINYADSDGNTSLHFAMEHNIETVKLLVKNGANVNAINNEGEMPLYEAVKLETIETVKFLLKNGANPNIRNKNNNLPLFVAIEKGNLKIIKYLVKNADNIDVKNTEGDAPLHLAVKLGNIELVKYLIKNGAKVNNKNDDEYRPLHIAINLGNMNMMKCLVESGANVDSRGGAGKDAPLHFAIRRVGMEKKDISLLMVGYLIKNKASINRTNSKWQTPLHEAVLDGKFNIAEFLINSEAKLNKQDIHGMTPLHYTAQKRNYPIAKLLIKNGAKIDIKNNHEETPLLLASKSNDLDITEKLLKTGANPNNIDSEGNTPLHLTRNYEITSLLVENGADVISKNINGDTPLHLNAIYKDLRFIKLFTNKNPTIINDKNNNKDTLLHIYSCVKSPSSLDVIKFLLDNGAEINSVNNKEKTPLDEAVDCDSWSAQNILLKSGGIYVTNKIKK